jgi:hypothetical protein
MSSHARTGVTMYRQQILSRVRSILLDAVPHLRLEQVTEAASLTSDLDMDPSHLDVLISRLTAELAEADIAFTPWYVQASRGHDTVGSLVDFLVDYTWQSDINDITFTDERAPVAPVLPEAAIHQSGRSALLA